MIVVFLLMMLSIICWLTTLANLLLFVGSILLAIFIIKYYIEIHPSVKGLIIIGIGVSIIWEYLWHMTFASRIDFAVDNYYFYCFISAFCIIDGTVFIIQKEFIITLLAKYQSWLMLIYIFVIAWLFRSFLVDIPYLTSNSISYPASYFAVLFGAFFVLFNIVVTVKVQVQIYSNNFLLYNVLIIKSIKYCKIFI